MNDIKTSEKVVIVLDSTGETFDNMNDAMIKGIENDLLRFANLDSSYDDGETITKFILDNKKEVYNYVRTLLNLDDKLDDDGLVID